MLNLMVLVVGGGELMVCINQGSKVDDLGWLRQRIQRGSLVKAMNLRVRVH